MKQSALILLLICFIFNSANSKFASGQQSVNVFNRNSFTYLTKMAYSVGRGDYSIRVQFNKAITSTDVPKTIPLKFAAYTDQEWERAYQLDECSEKLKQSSKVFDVPIPTDGSWSVDKLRELSQKQRTYVWFFVLADCEKTLTKYLTSGNKLKWEMEMTNSDGSQFSEEENGVLGPLVVIFLLLVVFFGNNFVKLYKFYNHEEGMDYPTLILLIALMCELFALGCEVIHLWSYSGDGKGLWLFNFGNQGWSILSQFIITCLLLLIAYGWSIKFIEFEDMDIFLPIGILLGVLHLMIVGLGRITDNEHYHFHDYESWAGIVIIILRMIMYGFFVYLFWDNYSNARGDEKEFYKQFGMLSTAYFMALPFIVIVASMFIPQYYRHKFVLVGNTGVQVIVMIIFTYLFTTKKNKYYNVSLKGKTLVMSNMKLN